MVTDVVGLVIWWRMWSDVNIKNQTFIFKALQWQAGVWSDGQEPETDRHSATEHQVDSSFLKISTKSIKYQYLISTYRSSTNISAEVDVSGCIFNVLFRDIPQSMLNKPFQLPNSQIWDIWWFGKVHWIWPSGVSLERALKTQLRGVHLKSEGYIGKYITVRLETNLGDNLETFADILTFQVPGELKACKILGEHLVWKPIKNSINVGLQIPYLTDKKFVL